MITSVQLTEAGAAKFNQWFAGAAKTGVRMEVVAMELCDIMADRLASGESLSYELGRQYTADGVPAHITLEAADLEVTQESDE